MIPKNIAKVSQLIQDKNYEEFFHYHRKLIEELEDRVSSLYAPHNRNILDAIISDDDRVGFDTSRFSDDEYEVFQKVVDKLLNVRWIASDRNYLVAYHGFWIPF